MRNPYVLIAAASRDCFSAFVGERIKVAPACFQLAAIDQADKFVQHLLTSGRVVPAGLKERMQIERVAAHLDEQAQQPSWQIIHAL